MRILSCLLLAYLMLAFSSCKKEEPDESLTPHKVSNEYHKATRSNFHYWYTPDESLREKGDDVGNTKWIYKYNGNTILEKSFANGVSTSPVASTLYFLNTKGVADSAVQLTEAGGTIARIKYTYDAEGYLINEVRHSKFDSLLMTIQTTISGGNPTTIHTVSNDTVIYNLPSSETSCSYITDHFNTTGNNSTGRAYLGRSSKNPVQRTSTTSSAGTTNLNYRYTYDGNGRIASQVSYDDGGAVIDSIAYQYLY